ncbi:hypothetical protein BR93DRAFT_299338 [Coniochaeta sp. PMI_546]|nr:hypothetical protein BR93DRAFT_299338 [Coniochaeta sp. PMI_546]
MLIDLGMGVGYQNVQYDCRVLCTYRKVYAIRAKQALASDGLYRGPCHHGLNEREANRGAQASSRCEGTNGPDEGLFVPRNPSIFIGLGGLEFERLAC